jgi:hypothetical protein
MYLSRIWGLFAGRLGLNRELEKFLNQLNARQMYISMVILHNLFLEQGLTSNIQSHYREVPRWEIFMEQELRFGLDLGQMANFLAFIASNLLTYETII